MADKPDFRLTLNPVIVFAKNIGALTLNSSGPTQVGIFVYAGGAVEVGVLECLDPKKSDKNAAAMMLLNYATRRLAGAIMRPGFAPQGGQHGMMISDDVPLSSEMIFHGLETAFPDLRIEIVRNWG